ncbi:hypothetical protein Hanom_Chr03g00213091 [Helianthus anomalus]
MKKFEHPYWRLLMHMFIMCMTENIGGTDQLNITQSATFICPITNQPFNYSKYVFEGMKRNVTGVRKDKFIKFIMYPTFLIALEKFGQFAETEEVAVELVIVQPEPVNASPVNIPVNAIIAKEHVVQAAVEEEPELLPEAEVSSAVSTFQPVISTESLGLLIKSVTEKMGNPPFDPLFQSEEQTAEDPKDPDTQQVKRRRDLPPGVYIEQNKDQPTTAAEDDDGLYDFDFEKDTTATAVDTKTWFDFDVDTTRMYVDVNLTEIPVGANVSAPIIESTQAVTVAIASSSGTVRNHVVQRDEEKIVVLVQDSIHKDVKIIQLEDTIVQKNRHIDQLQGDVSLLFNMLSDLRGKLEKKFGDAFSDPTDTDSRRKSEEDRARDFAKDDAERAAAMDHYFKKSTKMLTKQR